MKIELSQPFAMNGEVDEFDVRQMKKALNRLGYYRPYDKVGITGIAEEGVFNALKSFQTDFDLSPTGAAKPDDETIAALNREIAKAPEGHYIWRTVGDDKVRSAHAVYNYTVRNWSDSPDPGEDYNCRCWAEPIEPGLNPVYPELLLIPLLRVGRLYNLWRIWTANKGTDWVLGTYKSHTRWGNQLRDRNWTPEQITETLKYGKQHPAPNYVNKGNTATRYEYRGRYVVRDDETKEILQIGEPHFIRSTLAGE